MAADTGSLNRLPKICGNDSWIREIALTARRFDETEALQHGNSPQFPSTIIKLKTFRSRLKSL